MQYVDWLMIHHVHDWDTVELEMFDPVGLPVTLKVSHCHQRDGSGYLF